MPDYRHHVRMAEVVGDGHGGIGVAVVIPLHQLEPPPADAAARVDLLRSQLGRMQTRHGQGVTPRAGDRDADRPALSPAAGQARGRGRARAPAAGYRAAGRGGIECAVGKWIELAWRNRLVHFRGPRNWSGGSCLTPLAPRRPGPARPSGLPTPPERIPGHPPGEANHPSPPHPLHRALVALAGDGYGPEFLFQSAPPFVQPVRGEDAVERDDARAAVMALSQMSTRTPLSGGRSPRHSRTDGSRRAPAASQRARPPGSGRGNRLR